MKEDEILRLRCFDLPALPLSAVTDGLPPRLTTQDGAAGKGGCAGTSAKENEGGPA